MPAQAKDMTGLRFGRLTVIYRCSTNSGDGAVRWICSCDCGGASVAVGRNLRSGSSTSCGCQKGNKTHGARHTPEYEIWKAMRARCENSNNKGWKNYGARGIVVCDRWKYFENFLADMGLRPAGLSIERVDNNGNYEPGNCKWGTRVEQSRNRRNCRYVMKDGERLTFAEAARLIGISPGAFARRKGAWHIDRDVFEPPQRRKT